ncbi:MAG: hypothetical protein ACRDTO_08865 [Mycobacterium sp.]
MLQKTLKGNIFGGAARRSDDGGCVQIAQLAPASGRYPHLGRYPAASSPG